MPGSPQHVGGHPGTASGRSDADDVEAHACPKCEAQPGSPCRSRGGAVASAYHTRRFTKVPRLKKALRVPTPADRGPGRPLAAGHPAPGPGRPGPPGSGHPHRLRPLLHPRPGTRLPARRARWPRHPPGQDLQREDQHPRTGPPPLRGGAADRAGGQGARTALPGHLHRLRDEAARPRRRRTHRARRPPHRPRPHPGDARRTPARHLRPHRAG